VAGGGADFLEVMGPVGHQPGVASREPLGGRAIGVVVSTPVTSDHSRTLDAIASAAAAERCAITLIPLESPTQAAVSGAFRRLGEHVVDGVVALVEECDVNWCEIESPGAVPVVVVGANPRDGYAVVGTDQARGVAMAIEHLLGLGHETVWHIAGPTQSFAAACRERSWRETLLRFDRNVPLSVVGDWSAEAGYTLGQLLYRDPAVTAVFAANDRMALGLLRALREAGRAVPGEVSVVGFDDAAEAAWFCPSLTTVRQSFEELGRRAVGALLDAISGRPVVPALVPASLVVRDSTGRPPW
jgi:DNA-binding LacI/PurR family transcriptional regulator